MLIYSDPAILHAIINILPALCKLRPAIAPLLVSSIGSWKPTAMQNAGRPAMQIRAVDKTLRSVMIHLIKYVESPVMS
jgi:symplekin